MKHRKYSTFLIISFVAVSILGVYSYIYNLKSEAASSDNAISSSLDSVSGSLSKTNTSDKTNEDIAFLMKLASLNKINIDTSLFGNQSFKLLVDNNIKLEQVPYGRSNPFSPTDKIIVNNKPTYSLKTINATAISSTTAVLNGSIEGTTSNNIYFEYGTTELLGKVTPKVIPSLVGSVGSNLTLLNPKTKYFFRIVANINGLVIFGDIMSFTTN